MAIRANKLTELPGVFKTLDKSKIPSHIAMIMDGNGRWAKAQGKGRTAGHRAGMERLCSVVRTSSDIGLDALTLYAFSTENWKRPTLEVEALFSLLVEYLRREIEELDKNKVVLKVMGDMEGLPALARKEVTKGIERTKDNTGMRLNIALNYGSRMEIVEASKQIAALVAAGGISIDSIDENLFASKLQSYGLPEVDLLVRTSGEQRLSNFMLYQIAYSELVFTDVHWPDFSDKIYYSVLEEYMQRERRFGAIE